MKARRAKNYLLERFTMSRLRRSLTSITVQRENEAIRMFSTQVWGVGTSMTKIL